MKKDRWVWMPHAGHLIIGHKCQFKLNTYVGKYIVSTVGEHLPDEGVREIFNQTRNLGLEGRGDAREYDFIRKNGYEELGYGRTFETMVFKAIKSKDKCCPYKMLSGTEVDMDGYKTAADAFEGHLKLCKKWSNK